MPYSGVPRDEVSVPDDVRAVAAADQITVVWANELGGLTFELIGVDRHFVKWAPVESSLDLEGEAERMRWAGRYAAHVPTVLDVRRSDEGAVLITAPIPGENAVSERWKREPLIAVRAIGAVFGRCTKPSPSAIVPSTGPLSAASKLLNDGT